MLGSFVIVFREVIEVGLVIGIVLAATRGLVGRGAWIGLGMLGGVLGACLVALFSSQIAGVFEGTGQELLNAGVLVLAVLMLGWHNAWMASHGRELAGELKSVGRDVVAGRRPLTALAIVCLVAVLREGSEVVLFLYGVGAGGGTSALEIVGGGALGIIAGGLLSALIYYGLVAIPMRHLFGTLTVLITFLAAGLGAQAASFLQQGGWVDLWSRPLWSTAQWLPVDSIPGRLLHTIVGYTDRPSGLEVVVYVGILIAMWALIRAVAAKGGDGHTVGAGA